MYCTPLNLTETGLKKCMYYTTPELEFDPEQKRQKGKKVRGEQLEQQHWRGSQERPFLETQRG